MSTSPLLLSGAVACVFVSLSGDASAGAQEGAAPTEWESCDAPPDNMSCIPGGPFVRGANDDQHVCDQDGRPRMTSPDTHPEATVRLQTFYMDLTEVTNAEYAECVTAGRCRKAGPTYRDFSAPRQPVTGVSWFDSVSYCTFRGKHLPTEAEWEKAARGPDGEVYPWGNQPATCELAVIRDSAGRSCGEKKRLGTGPETGRVLEVGSRPAGRYGLYDMIGNAEEWVFDWYSSSYEACGADCLGSDPRGPCSGMSPCKGHCYRVVRGGSWYWPASHATGYHRRPHFPDNGPKRFHHFGFRCAASAEEARKIKPRE